VIVICILVILLYKVNEERTTNVTSFETSFNVP